MLMSLVAFPVHQHDLSLLFTMTCPVANGGRELWLIGCAIGAHEVPYGSIDSSILCTPYCTYKSTVLYCSADDLR